MKRINCQCKEKRRRGGERWDLDGVLTIVIVKRKRTRRTVSLRDF